MAWRSSMLGTSPAACVSRPTINHPWQSAKMGRLLSPACLPVAYMNVSR